MIANGLSTFDALCDIAEELAPFTTKQDLEGKGLTNQYLIDDLVEGVYCQAMLFESKIQMVCYLDTSEWYTQPS